MKKILIGIILLMILFWTPQLKENVIVKTQIKDTVKVFAVTTNLFHIVVPSLIDGQGYGKNIPDLQKTDTMFFIQYPEDKAYQPIPKDSLRLKLNKLLL